jgi:hypothetical protein
MGHSMQRWYNGYGTVISSTTCSAVSEHDLWFLRQSATHSYSTISSFKIIFTVQAVYNFEFCQWDYESGSSVCKVSDYGLKGQGSIPRGFFLQPLLPDRLWGPPSLLYTGYRGLFPRRGVKRGRGVMLTTHPLLVPRLRKSRSYTSCHQNATLWSLTGPLYLFLPMRLFKIMLASLRYVTVSNRWVWPRL